MGDTKDAMESRNVLTRQQRIAQNARKHPEVSFSSLAYHIDMEWMREAYRRTRKDAAPGVDEQTAEQFAEALGSNLASLLERAKAGSYRAPPVRRVHIPKGNGESRPIGIPTFEDKVLQRAVTMVLEPLYEQDFLDCSWGFRPGRSAHQALDALWHQLMAMGGGWIIDVDIRKFFDTVSRSHLQDILKKRVRDGVLTRLIGKWLSAGVLEEGQVHYPEQGTPQGGVISPMLSNIYLHEVLDRWFIEVVQKHLAGRAFLVRFADDAVLVFREERDARRVMAVLPKRFARYGLSIHPEKTRIVRFTKPKGTGGAPDTAETFVFLGFTHYWGRSRKGKWIVKRKTAASRFTRTLRAISQWCRVHRHLSVPEQHAALRRKLLGHYGYYGITGNGRSLASMLDEAKRVWHKWLARRGSRFNWERGSRLLARYPLPSVRVVHSIYAANL
jgi:group II intron reverse transcriptase/maturase